MVVGWGVASQWVGVLAKSFTTEDGEAGSRGDYANVRRARVLGDAEVGVEAGLASEVGLAVADFLDGRGDDGSGVVGMAEFEMHAAADVLELEHGASPSRAGDGNLHGLGTELGMAGEHGFAAAEKYGGVAVMHGLYAEHGGRRKIAEKDSAFDFGLDDAVVDFVGEVGVGAKHTNYQRIG
jgi:hypothetical protein